MCRYRAAFAQSRDAILFLDGDRLRDANPAAVSMFGVPDKATLTSLLITDLSPSHQPDGRPSGLASIARLDQVMQQGEAFFEWRHRRWDGLEFPAEVLLSRLDLDSGTEILATVRDISPRRETEAALRQREQELAEAHRIAHLGGWTADLCAGEVNWSDEACRILGIDREAPGCTLESFVLAVHPDDRERVRAAIEHALNGGQLDIVHRVVDQDGNVRMLRHRGHIQCGDDGAPARMIVALQDITEQRELETNLRRMAAVLDHTRDLVSMHDGEGAMLYMNAAARQFFGLPDATGRALMRPEHGWDRSGLPPETLSVEETVWRVHPEWAARKVLEEALPTARRSGFWEGETALFDAQGREVPVSQAIIVQHSETGEIRQTSTIIRDITERRALEDRLRQEKRLSDSILKSLPGVFYQLDSRGHLVRWNDRMMAVTGRTATELNGLNALELLAEEDRQPTARAIQEVLTQGYAQVESRLITRRTETPYLFNGFRVELDGELYLLGVGIDISERKRLEIGLRRKASTDHLTGVANRQHLDAELKRALAYYHRHGGSSALVMFDLDRFKAINDTHGHETGDQVLLETTARVARELRDTDILARWGGEEFVVLLPETGRREGTRIAERLRRAIEDEPSPTAGAVTISLGVTTFRAGDTPTSVMARADQALYKAKNTGRNRVIVEDGDAPDL
ncbi:diguanylate cyclase [Thioalkalivibrio sp. ALE17]|nr:diguanylate cyclase [Thioalkalivibrio sp. ALE17]